MKVVQPFGAQTASGSMGGTTASHNRYGAYIRTRAIPTNPQTALQAAVRGTFANLSSRWPALTQVQREAWELYAQSVPRYDSLGRAVFIPGQTMYIACNSVRVQAGAAIIDTGPTTLTTLPLTPPTITITAGDAISVAFSAADEWTTPTGGGLSLFVTPAKSPAVNFCKGPYRYAGTIDSAATSPTSPQTIPTPFVYTEGARVFYRMVAFDSIGRISADVVGNVFCGA